MIAKNIKMLRQKHNMTQEQLADKMNVSRQAVTKWESGESLPDIESVRDKKLSCSCLYSPHPFFYAIRMRSSILIKAGGKSEQQNPIISGA
jgi:transcriptional regulator with XRE-family HTH domain